MLFPVLQGFAVGASLIIPIGAQNAHVLNCGLRRQHHLLVASLCLFCDLVLILFGVFGGGRWLGDQPWLQSLLTWGGVCFLAVYGFRSFKTAWLGEARSLDQAADLRPGHVIVLSTLAVTLLNPHVYLDTVMILGSVSVQWPKAQQPWFALGAILASTVWFYGLALLAARLAPWLGRARVQRGIDLLIGVLMWLIAGSLVWSVWIEKFARLG